MRIGFMIPSEWSLNRGHGVVAQARHQAEALESIGHTVDFLSPWAWQDIKDLDVLHFFGGCVVYPALNNEFRKPRRTLVAYSPIIDSGHRGNEWVKVGHVSLRSEAASRSGLSV